MASSMSAAAVDGVLVQWGDRLFDPRNLITPATRTPRLTLPIGHRAAQIRQRIQATVARRAPQVMVRLTGGGRGMEAIANHFRYISKSGRFAFEDDRGVVREGREALHGLTEQWRYGGTLIDQTGDRREARNLILSMPRGTDAQAVLQSAREFARIELRDHRYVMVLHEHQENPHVHLCVKVESMSGKRLRLRPSDLRRWRETFAERLRGLGIDAEATAQYTRVESRRPDRLWQIKARKQGQLRQEPSATRSGEAFKRSRNGAMLAWAHITAALEASDRDSDRQLAMQIRRFVLDTNYVRAIQRTQERDGRGLRVPHDVGSLDPREQHGPERTR